MLQIYKNKLQAVTATKPNPVAMPLKGVRAIAELGVLVAELDGDEAGIVDTGVAVGTPDPDPLAEDPPLVAEDDPLVALPVAELALPVGVTLPLAEDALPEAVDDDASDTPLPFTAAAFEQATFAGIL